jgi:hypothetical protein
MKKILYSCMLTLSIFLLIGMEERGLYKAQLPLYKPLSNGNNMYTSKQLAYTLSSSLCMGNYVKLFSTAQSIALRNPFLESCFLSVDQDVVNNVIASSFKNELTYVQVGSLRLANVLNKFLVTAVAYHGLHNTLYFGELNGSVFAIAQPSESFEYKKVYHDVEFGVYENFTDDVIYNKRRMRPIVVNTSADRLFYNSLFAPRVLRTIDLHTKCLIAKSEQTSAVMSVGEYDDDTNSVYMGMVDGNVGCYTQDGKEIYTQKVFRSAVIAIKKCAVNQIAVAGKDTVMKIWDIRKIAPVPLYLCDHEKRVTDLAVMHDGNDRLLLSVSLDKKIRFWVNGACVRAITTSTPITKVVTNDTLIVSQQAVDAEAHQDHQRLLFWSIDSGSCVGRMTLQKEHVETVVGLTNDNALITLCNRTLLMYRSWLDKTNQNYRHLISCASLIGLYCARKLKLL